MQLFGNVSLQFEFWNDVYHVYDTDNNVVWEEVDEWSDLDWTLDALIGFAIRLSGRFVIATTAGGIYSWGDTRDRKYSLPYSRSPIPVGTAVDLTNSSDFYLTLTISGALEL